MPPLRTLCRFSLAGLALLLAGCGESGPQVFPVTGKVTLRNGTPLRGGMILLESSGKPSLNGIGIVGDDGSYAIRTKTTPLLEEEGAVAGRHLVSFCPAIRNGGLKKYEDVIHERYLDFDSSGMTIEVTNDPAKNTFDFVLDPPGR